MCDDRDDLGLSEDQLAALTELVTEYFQARLSGRVATEDTTEEDAASRDGSDDAGVTDAAIRAAFEKVMDDSVEGMLADLRRNMPQMLADRRAARIGFEAHLYARWRRALDLFETVLVMTQEVSAEFNQKHCRRAAQENDFIFEALVRLHARASLTCSEVLALLTSGHPSGANARWRTLHELAVVSYFIKDRGQEVAERYLLHHIVESATSANDYQDYCARLGYEPLSAEEMAALEADKAALCRRFGPEYRHHYGWAAKALGSPRPTFKQIEAAVSLQHWRPYYGMASHSVHAKPKGIAFDLGNMFPSELMLAGPSNSGLADPGQSALISLFQITTILLGLKPDVREIMAMRTIQHFVGEAERAFVEAQRQLDDEERAARELHDSPEMTAEELAALQSRWGEAPHGAPHDENGYAMAHAPADIRRLLAEVMRRRESAGDS